VVDIGSTYCSHYTQLGERHSARIIWRQHHGVTSRSSLSLTACSWILSCPCLTALSHMTHSLPLPPATALSLKPETDDDNNFAQHCSMLTVMLPMLASALDTLTPTSPPLPWLQLLMTRIPTPTMLRTTYIMHLL
jgi:hypothetical protein